MTRRNVKGKGHHRWTVSFLVGALPFSAVAMASSYDQEDLPAVLPASRKIARHVREGRGALMLIVTQPWLIIVLVFRCITLSLLFVPLLILYPLMAQQTHLKLLWLYALLGAFELSGPTFMKFGQWMSTRRDIFTPELCLVFAALHRSTPPHSFRYNLTQYHLNLDRQFLSCCRATRRRMEAAFGDSWKGLIFFEGNNPQPIGSGCVGQVYKVKIDMVKLKAQADNALTMASHKQNDDFSPFDVTSATSSLHLLEEKSTEVSSTEAAPFVDAALKVLHPNIQHKVNRDLIIMEVGATVLEFLFRDLKWLRIRDSVVEFGSLMNRQLDLRVEAQNLLLFHTNFANFPSVRFPLPHFPFVSVAVLLESWEDGIPIGEFVDKAVSPAVRKELASIGVDVLLKMTFIGKRNLQHAIQAHSTTFNVPVNFIRSQQ